MFSIIFSTCEVCLSRTICQRYLSLALFCPPTYCSLCFTRVLFSTFSVKQLVGWDLNSTFYLFLFEHTLCDHGQLYSCFQNICKLAAKIFHGNECRRINDKLTYSQSLHERKYIQVQWGHIFPSIIVRESEEAFQFFSEKISPLNNGQDNKTTIN